MSDDKALLTAQHDLLVAIHRALGRPDVKVPQLDDLLRSIDHLSLNYHAAVSGTSRDEESSSPPPEQPALQKSGRWGFLRKQSSGPADELPKSKSLNSSPPRALSTSGRMQKSPLRHSAEISFKRESTTVDVTKTPSPRQLQIVDFEHALIHIGPSITGNIYHATVEGFGIACKVYQTGGMMNDLVAAARFKTNLEMMVALNHPHITKYFAFRISPDRVFLYMEAFDLSLRGFIDEHKKTKQEYAVIPILLQITRALLYLHETLKIMHRDLKSENVFVHRGNNVTGPVVKLGDFDEAIPCERGRSRTLDVGTPSFAAPETMSGSDMVTDEPYDFRADIWSFGFIIYELLTQRVPYDDVDPFKIRGQIMQGIVPKIPFSPGSIAPPLIALYNRCVSCVPYTRPSGMEIMTFLNHLK